MMSDIILNPLTTKKIKLMLASPAHAILLTGSPASLIAVGRHIAGELLQKSLINHPYYLYLEPKLASVSIEEARTLQRFFRLKTIGANSIRRVCLINSTGGITLEAQNALLRILEEPPLDSVLILTQSGVDTFLPTVLSRCTKLTVLPLSLNQAMTVFEGYTKSDIQKAWYIAKGDAILLEQILNNESGELTVKIESARSLLGSSLLERLATIDAFTKDKIGLGQLLSAISRIAQAALESSASKNNIPHTKKWLAILKATQAADRALALNANPKLLLTNMVLTLG